METEPTFYVLLKAAHGHANTAILLLDDALTTSASRVLEPKHRRLLQTTRNNLRRQNRILQHLTSEALKLAYDTTKEPTL